MKKENLTTPYERLAEKIFAGILILAVAGGIILSLTACSSTAGKLTKATAGKSVTMRGGISYLQGTITNPETGTPEITTIAGNVSYKGRIVGIGKEHRTPNTGNFRAVKSKGIFGGEEIVIEWDYTADSPETAKAVEKAMQEKASLLFPDPGKTTTAPAAKAPESPSPASTPAATAGTTGTGTTDLQK